MLSFGALVLWVELFFLWLLFLWLVFLDSLLVEAESLLTAGAAGAAAGAVVWAAALSDTAKALAISADINLFIVVLYLRDLWI
jgi:hypothetical protein